MLYFKLSIKIFKYSALSKIPSIETRFRTQLAASHHRRSAAIFHCWTQILRIQFRIFSLSYRFTTIAPKNVKFTLIGEQYCASVRIISLLCALAIWQPRTRFILNSFSSFSYFLRICLYICNEINYANALVYEVCSFTYKFHFFTFYFIVFDSLSALLRPYFSPINRTVTRSARNYNENSTRNFLPTSCLNRLGTMRHYSDFRGYHLILRRTTVVAHSTDLHAHRLY